MYYAILKKLIDKMTDLNVVANHNIMIITKQYVKVNFVQFKFKKNLYCINLFFDLTLDILN